VFDTTVRPAPRRPASADRTAECAAEEERPAKCAAPAGCAATGCAANGSAAPNTSPGNAAAADLAALAIRAALDRLSGALARAAAAFVSLRGWTVFGFARLDDHARERCGRSGRWFRDLAALGDGIAAAPPLADALTGADGGRPLGRVAATLVARVLRAEDRGEATDAWMTLARCLSVRDLRAAIRLARAAGEFRPDAGTTMQDAGALRSSADFDPDDPDADRVLVRLPVPSPMIQAFDEALDLHRAVEGHVSSVTAFVESLVGEAQSGGAELPVGFARPLEHGTPEALCEAALRRASGAWSALPEPFGGMAGLASSGMAGLTPSGTAGLASSGMAGLTPSGTATASRPGADNVSRFRAVEAVAGQGDAVELDRQIRALTDIETELEAELGRLLALMTERGDWSRLQFTGVGHYAEERLGMSRGRAGERARLARALRSFPAVAAACASGRISMEAAALIHRILSDTAATGDTAAAGDTVATGHTAAAGDDAEAAWVEHAATVTIKRIRDEARALGRYRARAYASHALPTGPAISPRPLPDGQWRASLRREAGTATRRIVTFGLRAAGFDLATDSVGFDSGPEPTEPDVFHALMPEPDATLRLRLPADLAADFLAAIEAACGAVEARVSEVPWDAPWPEGSAAEWAARVSFIRGRRVPMWVGLLALLEDFAATWDTDDAAPERRDDRVFVRDGWRCAAPGCSSRRHLEDHHIVYRSQGGDDRPANRVTLCRFHHQRGEHGGLMSVRGPAPGGLLWRLGRPDVAVAFRNERRSS
jgi:hypothetical protein